MAIHAAALLDPLPQDAVVYVGRRATPSKDNSQKSVVFHLWARDCGAMGGDGSPRSLTIADARGEGLGLCWHCARRAKRRSEARAT